MNKYWFRKRRGLTTKDLGWGWIPISWEGWLTMLIMLGIIAISAIVLLGDSIAKNIDPPVVNGFMFAGALLFSIGLGAFVSHKKTRP